MTATTPMPSVPAPSTEVTETDMVRKALDAEYEILEELGRGGMGIVFRAMEKALEREVAIKVLPFSLAFESEFVERFQREARTSAKLEHPNIIPIYRVGKSDRVTYFTMKFIRGHLLSDMLRAQGALQPSDVRALLIQTANALAYAHRNGIVHRDIKPDNIMIDELGHAVVMDFGIAKAATGTKLTGTGMAIGTPHYMSPEQIRAQAIDGRSDIYSLGIVTYQMLTGTVPFDGEEAFAIGYQHVSEPLPTPTLPSDEHRAIFDIVKQMTAKEPSERLQRAEDLVEALGGHVGSTSAAPIIGTSSGAAGPRSAPIAARTGSVTAETPTTPIPKQTYMTKAAPATRAKKSSTVGMFIFLFVILGAFGGGGYWLYHEGVLDDAIAMLSSGSDSAGVADSAAVDSSTPEIIPAMFAVSNLPDGALVRIDGDTVGGVIHTLLPGAHEVRISAPGFHEWVDTVTLDSGGEHTVSVNMRRRLDPCGRIRPQNYSPRRCYDQRPQARSELRVDVPAAIGFIPSSVTFWVYVTSDGETGDIDLFRASSNDHFSAVAREYLLDMTWIAARRGERAVSVWFQVEVSPREP